MHLVTILLPTADNGGHAYPEAALRDIQHCLTERFGGLTTYSRAPAKGVWLRGKERDNDDIVVLEVLVESLDSVWWKGFKGDLESKLDQTELMIRYHAVDLV